MTSNFIKPDTTYGSIDLDDAYVTDAWLVEQFVGNNLFASGFGGYGQLGNGSTSGPYSPIQIGSLIDWKQVSCGTSHTLAIKSDGTLWSWGRNDYGQLGQGNITNYSSPVQVGALTNWKQVSCSYASFLAIKTDGTLWGCGNNANGQLGQGNITPYSSPVQIGALTNWKQVSCSSDGIQVMVIKQDGTLWCCGSNYAGQLGDGTTTAKSSLIQIGSSTNWKQVACGANHTLAIKTDGTLWAWGDNSYGECGDGYSTRSSPTQIGTSTNWKQVTAGQYFSVGIKNDGTLWSWGLNNYSQLGRGPDGSNYSYPVQDPDLGTNWKSVSSGYYSTLAIRTDGTLWGWGYNGNGELGLGNANIYSYKTQVGNLKNWKQCGVGYGFSLSTKFSEI